jgi:peptidoglycan/LPS O-acetylase OafA/YrhL
MRYYKQIDGLRFIAIFGVLFAHWYQGTISNLFLKNLPGGTGVVLFFVISGFLITKILLDFRLKNEISGVGNSNSIKSFYIRRSLRIFPIYYLTIIFLLIINFSNIKELFPWLATYTLNIQMAITNQFQGSFTHLWSLAVEEQFYLCWMFVIVFVPKRNLMNTIIGAIFLSLIVKYFLFFKTGFWLGSNSLVICNMHSLGLGGLIAYASIFHPEKFEAINARMLRISLLAGIVIYLVIFCILLPGGHFIFIRHFEEPAVTIIYGLMVLIAAKNVFGGLIQKFLENRFIVYLGRISYGLYVYHAFMGPLYFNFLNRIAHIEGSDESYFVLFFTLDLAVASLSWYLIEKPVNNLKKYFSYSKPARV